MTEWAEKLAENGFLTAEESAQRAARWRPADHDPAHYPFPIRSDTGIRDLRQRDMVLGDRPEERGAKADQITVSPGTAYQVLNAVCETCSQEAHYLVRGELQEEFACPLHLFRAVAGFLVHKPYYCGVQLIKPLTKTQRHDLVGAATTA